MSDLDDLEEISEQHKHGVNEPKRGITRGKRAAFLKALRRGQKANRSTGKQQERSADRRRVLVKLPNQD
jgi:hypothetical protein